MKSDLHESYTKNDDNYRELKGVIQSLPAFAESNPRVGKCLQFDDQSDASDDHQSSDNEELLCSPFQSTPNMSTIQLQGSKHKSHFLSIHDLITNRSPQEVESDIHIIYDNHLSDKQEFIDSKANMSSRTELEVVPPSITSPTAKNMDHNIDDNMSDDNSVSIESNINQSEEL